MTGSVLRLPTREVAAFDQVLLVAATCLLTILCWKGVGLSSWPARRVFRRGDGRRHQAPLVSERPLWIKVSSASNARTRSLSCSRTGAT